MKRDHFNSQSFGSPLNTMVKEARILMVGAGGIGCELLKNLVLTGFGEIHIVDLDTIDLSNLNRQFLFRHEHIKKSKALVAKEAAHAFNPRVKLEAHHANIKDPQFNVRWFKGFTMVFNALDNLEARRHVNKMCLAAEVPLIESGTTGFNGQVQVIKKGVTACYDCAPKETPKSFPVCTIRSTPSQPIHCIVWGKSYLLSEVFGTSEDESVEMDHSEDSENATEIEKLRQESQALKNIKESMGTPSFPQLLFDKVYHDDVVRLRSMEEMWKTRRPPEALSYASIIEQAAETELSKEEVLKDGQRVWNIHENVVVFKDSLERLSQRFEEMKSSKSNGNSAEPTITFDKDDEDTLDFVTASANLRSLVFGIETKSRFDIKQMAGNIIPAIATTNAIVAGLCVLESFKVLRGEFSATKEVFLSPFAPERLLSSDRYRAPNPDCPVCSVAQVQLLVDMSRATLNDLVEDFLRLELGYGEEIVVNHGDSLLYDVEETDNLTKKLGELGIKSDSFLTVIDEDDENPKGPRVNLVLSVQESQILGDKPIKGVDLPASADTESDAPASPIHRKKKPSQPSNDTYGTVAATTTNGSLTVSNGTKRLFSEVEEGSSPKRVKLATNGYGSNDNAIVIDNGAIVIDD
ncbi:Ubiquitin-activating enzyme E1-like [Lachnellula subtilissima]|uniref:Ubiquitin-activating enzyme E1-like n=1 Tax=Lachnellula subtilissima TaxID=602034 RepID=A0A8H8RXQ0_9HELO|nr:Ubiquitin-activating enzyme E1-like [Lachnellula subtilissima]